MTAPVVSFFNNKGGVGKTTLVYHLAWMAADLGARVLAVDLDPQANLTAACLDEDRVERLWDGKRQTIYGAIAPLLDGIGDLEVVEVQSVAQRLHLLAGDLRLATAEQEFGQQWPNCLDGNARAFRVVSAVARATRQAAKSVDADVILVDVGPSLGAINRVAMVASDYVVVPLSPDLYSIQGLRNLGPTLKAWRREWSERRSKNPSEDLWLPEGRMEPAGYVVLQHGVRVDRAVGAYDRWIRRVPAEYRESVLGVNNTGPAKAEDDPYCLGLVKHFHSLVPMAQEARKPIFKLRSADGAIGAHQQAVSAASNFFEELTRKVLVRTGAPVPRSSAVS
jgi:chromosome partitioning protein